MSEDFFSSKHCSSRKHCQACRNANKDNFRKSVNAFYNTESVDFECPYGVGWGYQKSKVNAIEEVDEATKKAEERKISQEKKKKEILAQIEAQNAGRLKNRNDLNSLVRSGKLRMLDHKYIMNNLKLFRKMDGFDAQFKECDNLMAEAVALKKCTACARGKINRKLVNFSVANIDSVVEFLPDDLVIPGNKPMKVIDLKKGK
jgi:hypothetical protein